MSAPEFVDATQGLHRSGVVYAADIAKRCMMKGCRAKSEHVLVAYSFDTDSFIHSSVCEACLPRAKEEIKHASAVDSAALSQQGRSPS